MKKTLISAFAAAMSAAAFAGMNNVTIMFSTPGPDKYADGTSVRDGEKYALVWTKNGEEFAGIDANGNSADANSVVVAAVEVAKSGCCPLVEFQVDDGYVDSAGFANGTWSVVLLDTRKFAVDAVTGKPVDAFGNPIESGERKVLSVGRDNAINGYGVVSANVVVKSGESGSSCGVAAQSDSSASDMTPPVVEGIEVKGDYVYVTVRSTDPAHSYALVSGSNPESIADEAADSAKYGKNNGVVTLVKRKSSGASGEFFKVNCK